MDFGWGLGRGDWGLRGSALEIRDVEGEKGGGWGPGFNRGLSDWVGRGGGVR